MSTLYNFAFYLPFGLAFVVPADFLPELGAAFLALAFVAILVKCVQPQPSEWDSLPNNRLLIQSAYTNVYVIFI